MCGICGIVVPRGSSRRLDADVLERMRDSIAHRGPDAAGAWYNDGAALGHRRLSIVDLAHGQQPMASDEGNLHIVYNGEVFNHPSLMVALESMGVQYRTHCDTETVLRLYERHGAATPEQLRGMFAFAIWNSARHELFLCRDRFGVKPLYYVHADDGSLYFASEIKSLLAADAVKPVINFNALPDQFANHGTSGDETLFAGVKRLLPGYSMVWKDGRLDIREFWDLS